MDFEFIEESEIITSRGGRPKKEKIVSQFDSPLADRTYWGRNQINEETSIIDPGTELSMTLMRSKIRYAVRHNYLIDIDDHEVSIRLMKEFRDELKKFQMAFLQDYMSNQRFEIVRDEFGNYFIQTEVV